jgi:hypothetical protein
VHNWEKNPSKVWYFRASKYSNRHCFDSKYACATQPNSYCARAQPTHMLRSGNTLSYANKSWLKKHRGKTSAHASTLLKSVLWTWCQVFRMLSKTQNGRDFDVLPFLLKCKRNDERDNLKSRNNYSLHVQEVVLCKRINQRWLSINLLYKTFFNWTIQRYIFFVGSYDPHFC